MLPTEMWRYDGNVALRLDLTDNGAGAQDHGLDRYSTRIPVEYGTSYIFSFDAAWISGTGSLVVVMRECDSAGTSLLQQQVIYPLSNVNYQEFSQNWSPKNPLTTTIYLRFLPQAEEGGSISLLLDNVQLNNTPTTLTLGNLLQTYDGLPQSASYHTTNPEGLPADLTYDGLTNKPLNAGSYTVIGTIYDLTYQGSATNILTIQTSGAYNAWKRESFTTAEQTNAAISGPEADYDSDDFNNWEEYIAYTDPTDGQAFPTVHAQSGATANEFVLSWPSVSNRSYSVQMTPDLMQPFLPLQTNIVWPQSSYTSQMNNAESYYQVDAALPYCSFPVHSNATSKSEIIGSSHVNQRYYFGTEDCLNEGASALLAMGSKVIKVWYWNGYEIPNNFYPWNSTWPESIPSLADGLNTHFGDLFDKPFKTFVMNVASFVNWNTYYWRTSITQDQIDQEEIEFYEFTKALLQRYEGTGKIFIFQTHEGDWHTRAHADRSLPPVEGAHERMIQWLNARQRGVTRAREEIRAQDVFVYNAAEVNMVISSMESDLPNMVNEVLPHTQLDLVSYSCYESSLNPTLAGDPEALRRAIKYIKLMMPDSAAFGNDNVYLGEYGIPENNYTSTQIEKR